MSDFSDNQTIDQAILLKYQILQKLGSGAYGHVWKVMNRKDHEIYALKKIYSAFQNSLDAERTFRQISILKKLNHPNVVKLQKILKSQNGLDLYLVFQLVESDLFKALKAGILKQDHKKYIIYQIAKTLKYIHSAGVIHRDLKPSNILVNSDCKIKLCDFGLSRTIFPYLNKEPVQTQFIATRWYRAPEVMLGSKSYTQKADIWSLGCLIYQMYALRTLFPGKNNIDQIQKMLEFKGYPNEEEKLSLQVKDIDKILGYFKTEKKPLKDYLSKIEDFRLRRLLMSMLEYDPQKRPSAKQILSDTYLEQLWGYEDEFESQEKIKLEHDENQKVHTREYRQLIYENFVSEQNKKNNRKGQIKIKISQPINNQEVARFSQKLKKQTRNIRKSTDSSQAIIINQSVYQEEQDGCNLINTLCQQELKSRRNQSVSMHNSQNNQNSKTKLSKRTHKRQKSQQLSSYKYFVTKQLTKNQNIQQKQSFIKLKKRPLKLNTMHNQNNQNQKENEKTENISVKVQKLNNALKNIDIDKQLIPQQTLSIKWINTKYRTKKYSKSLNVSPEKTKSSSQAKNIGEKNVLGKNIKTNLEPNINQSVHNLNQGPPKFKNVNLPQNIEKRKSQGHLPQLNTKENKTKMGNDQERTQQQFYKNVNCSVNILKGMEPVTMKEKQKLRKINKRGITYFQSNKIVSRLQYA